MTIFFDHCYCNFIPPESYIRLSQYGFSTNVDYCIEHEGGSFCRFIKVGNRYLEFVHIPNPIKHQKHEHDKNYPPHSAGISFKIDHPLKAHFEIIRKQFPQIRSEYHHRNYNWTENSTDYLPGWNFLSLKSPIVKDLYFWFTEHENSPEREKRKDDLTAQHENTATNISGLIMDFSNESSKELLAKIAKGTLENGHILLEDNTRFYDAQLLNVAPLSKKKTALKAAIIKVSNFPKAREICSDCEILDFQGSLAIHVPQHESAFDILLV